MANINSNCWFIIPFGSFANLQIFRVGVEIGSVLLEKNESAFLNQSLSMGIDDITTSRKSLPVNLTRVRDSTKIGDGYMDHISLLALLREILPLKAAAKNML